MGRSIEPGEIAGVLLTAAAGKFWAGVCTRPVITEQFSGARGGRVRGRKAAHRTGGGIILHTDRKTANSSALGITGVSSMVQVSGKTKM